MARPRVCIHLTLISMTKALIPVLALAAIGSGAFAFMQKNRADDLQAQIEALKSTIAQHEGDGLRLKSANDKLAELLADNERLKRERDDAKARNKEIAAAGEPGRPATAAPAANQPPDIRNFLQGFAKQMDDPEVRKSMKAGQQQQIAAAYEAIFKKLNLSEDEAKLVAELLADRNFTAMDQGRKLLNGKTDDASMEAVRKEITGTKLETDAKLKGMLGEEKFKELTSFEQTVGDQRALDGMARNFERKSMPLEPQQKEALANIMREERLRIPSDDIPDLGRGPGMSVLLPEAEVKARQAQEEAYQASVLNRAGQAGLSPDQVNVLRDSFAERNQRQAMSRIMGRAFLGGGAPR
jgi:hypothetical protein